jgi:hypothetical protein
MPDIDAVVLLFARPAAQLINGDGVLMAAAIGHAEINFDR